MTCSTCNNLYVKRCEISQRCGIWSRHHNIWSAALAGVKTVVVTKNGSDETTLVYDILYINRTSFLCRFRIWNQNSNIPSVASDIACFVCINSANDQFSHSRCSNCYNCFNCGQEAVLYVQIMGQKSLHQISSHWLWYKPTSDTCRFWPYITHLWGISWPISSHNTFNKSHLMGIVRIKRVYHKIPSIGECTYTTLLKTVQYADYNLISPICQW